MSAVTDPSRRVLVTGGAGFIGSHTCIDLLDHGHELVVVDNLSNSSAEALDRVAEVAGRAVEFHELDLRDREALDKVMAASNVDSVVHFAGLKRAVNEAMQANAEALKMLRWLQHAPRSLGAQPFHAASSPPQLRL